MSKKLLLTLTGIIAFGFITNAQTVNIPDANFKAYLVGNTAINTNGDTEIQVSEASAFTGLINCGFSSISDLTGIEAFTALTELRCHFNSLTTIDISNNTALTLFACNSNSLTNLDISNNTALTVINCSSNALNALDVSNNTALTELYCHFNSLTTLDISNNTALISLNCQSNALTALDVSNNTSWTFLQCQDNSLTSINLSNINSITTFDCYNNSLTSLDVSNITNLSNFSCYNNSLTSLNVSNITNLNSFDCSENSLTSLNIANGNNTIINPANFNTTSNPNLTCIQVDDVAYSTTNWTNIDAGASFSTNCNAVLVSSITVQGQGGVSTISTNAGTLQMLATVLPANADDVTYTWSVLNAIGAATIDANGLLTAVSDGPLDVIATANDGSGVTGSTTITISNQGTTPVLVSSITVQGQNGDSTITTNGGSLQMEAAVLPMNADDMTYTWSVTNGTGSATIDAAGLLIATADGTVEVTATANDASGTMGTKTIIISNQSVGINDLAFENVSIYPNPTNGIINLDISEDLSSIKIMDLTGKTIQVFNVDKNQLDISGLNTGVYFLEISNAEKKSVMKIIKK